MSTKIMYYYQKIYRPTFNRLIAPYLTSFIRSTLFFLIFSIKLLGQNSEIDRLITGELQMTFPSIYFKHNSTDYAAMPYSTDSCFKYIALNFDNSINSLVLWRDSTETEVLANKRIQKLKLGLKKQIKNTKIEIYSMGDQQKISRHTIKQNTDKLKTNYLLSLNSVFEISKTRVNKKIKYNNHIMSPSITCWGCWKSGFHLQSRRKFKKIEKRNREKTK